MVKIHKGKLSQVILLALEKTVDGYVRLEDFLYNTHIYARGYDRPLKKSEFSQALKRLRERGLIEQSLIDEGKIIFKLTQLGRDALGANSFNTFDWDSIWRVVIFDIPEDKRRIRDQFRRKLKHWGFKNWQQSVWVTKNNVTDKLRSLIDELGIGQWVAVLESANISADKQSLPFSQSSKGKQSLRLKSKAKLAITS